MVRNLTYARLAAYSLKDRTTWTVMVSLDRTTAELLGQSWLERKPDFFAFKIADELLGQSWLERKPDFFAFKIAD
jgi:hypothetical protein